MREVDRAHPGSVSIFVATPPLSLTLLTQPPKIDSSPEQRSTRVDSLNHIRRSSHALAISHSPVRLRRPQATGLHHTEIVMQSTSAVEQTSKAKQSHLAENLARADQARARRRTPTSPPLFPQPVTQQDHIIAVCDDLLRLGAGLQAVLNLLDLQGDVAIECAGLHALLAPLKQQVDHSANQLLDQI